MLLYRPVFVELMTHVSNSFVHVKSLRNLLQCAQNCTLFQESHFRYLTCDV